MNLKFLRSRTVWTIVVLFIVNGFEGVRELLPGNWLPTVDFFLSAAAIYFRMNPRVK
ncbi:MAG: hypothetical protein QME51_08965 [Planctomycetota bacterium]|nr:hypothetical protein [Planctomycetota bacterium]